MPFERHSAAGRAAFVSRIDKFVGSFPDVKIDDQIIMVDGKSGVICIVITGTQTASMASSFLLLIRKANSPPW
jgi:hypothetical protein